MKKDKTLAEMEMDGDGNRGRCRWVEIDLYVQGQEPFHILCRSLKQCNWT